ncbi:o-succinylbenzoate synthase [Marinoscillum sp. MHG1-6]|uniref:o-succinylbenzoate synthase n=1 Tax=Marinoscillum sp. MHG1-6 TaxID=2959627 RepID=UPI002157C9A6|nr:o-succinylbenzoate synthase [Marinoscillum sp. MHG1-6]
MLEYKDYTLDFKFEAGTSRGVMRQHRAYLLKISANGLSPFGYGEAAPLPRLSVDDFEELEPVLLELINNLRRCELPSNQKDVFDLVAELVSPAFPSVRFALETALLDLLHRGNQIIFPSEFLKGQSIPINGLIWMGDQDFMRTQVDKKLEAGFTCIKIKVGAIDWEHELDIIQYIRSKSRDVTIRLDANGGFPTNEVFARLKDLDGLDIHSIEQPIMPRQPEAMRLICEKSKIPIVLDEELIGITDHRAKKVLLEDCLPAFIILKPTLLGGFRASLEWIKIAEELGIDWWFTSALESNVGLNAISQFAASLEPKPYHGLGTGQLYHNNIMSPLTIEGERLHYNHTYNWHMPF